MIDLIINKLRWTLSNPHKTAFDVLNMFKRHSMSDVISWNWLFYQIL